MKKSKYIVSILVMGATLMMTSCGENKQSDKKSSETVAKEYEVLSVKSQDITTNTSYSASIRGKQDIDIYPQISGVITQVNVTEGQKVVSGQTLFIIDQVPYTSALRTAQANVERAKAALATAKLQYQSNQELFNKNIISEFELSKSQNEMAKAQAELSQMEAQEIKAKNDLSYTVIKSPSNGVVGTLPYRRGSLVSPNMQQPLTTVSDNSNMYVYFSLNENQILNMIRLYGSQDKALKNMPPVSLQLGDKTYYEEKGKIESISGVIDRTTGTASIRAVFPNKNGLLRSGGTGNIIIPSDRKGVLVIPTKTTFEIQDKKYVYKLIDGEARSQEIKVTPVEGGIEYIVESGLNEGDIIVAEGVGLLREGTPIKAKNTVVETPTDTTKSNK